MPRPRPYTPPALNYRVRIRNPANRPEFSRDDVGRATNDPDVEDLSWQIDVWAGRRDREPQQLLEEAAIVYAMTTIWVIRYRRDVDPDVEVVYDGRVFRSVGPPVERGGPEYGRAAKYLEIHSRLRE